MSVEAAFPGFSFFGFPDFFHVISRGDFKSQCDFLHVFWLKEMVGITTPQKTNMEPEKNALEREKHLQTTNFWVPC